MKDFKIILKKKIDVCDNTIAFIFSTMGVNYNFKPGQYAHFTIPNPVSQDKKGNSRPFSIASSPHHKNHLMIAARKGSSVFINNLDQLTTGAEIFVSKPYGNLLLNENISDTPVFIAGGIGVTPVRSIIEKFIYDKNKSKLFLFHSNRNRSQFVFKEDFEKWSAQNSNFKFIPVIDDLNDKLWKYDSGVIDKKLLKKHLKSFSNKIFYIVGPPAMVDNVNEILLHEKVNPEKIITEKFK